MPDTGTTSTPSELAAASLEAWLDGPAAAFARRSQRPDSRRKVASWEFDLEHPALGPQRVRLSVPRDFPATPPEIHFDARLCLVLPHIEEDGKFCHGVLPSPGDYAWPEGGAQAVLQSLQRFWTQVLDPAWVLSEFHRERLSYWQRFCEQFRTLHKAPAPRTTRVVLQQLDGVAEGKLAVYFRRSQAASSDLMVATVGDADPHSIAVRHRWNVGALVRGHVLFVPVPANVRWAPCDWPRTLQELERFVGQITGGESSVVRWVEAEQDQAPQPFVVVLVQDNTCYGYLLTPAPVPLLTVPGITPIVIDRVDVNWVLARDYQLPTLGARAGKKVLVLGCGSLGAPVAELLARAGIGKLDLLDMEAFEAENCARHILGASDIGRGKAESLAVRLRQLVPGIEVGAYRARATDWIQSVCKPDAYDLVVDCTGESHVRVMLAHYRSHSVGPCPMVHAWVEPFCAAAHVVHIAGHEVWPDDDPGERVAAASWGDDVRINLPACGAGFHPYGASDAWQAAGYAAERILAVLDGKVEASTVWSWVRSKSFFDSLEVDVTVGPLVPTTGSAFDSVQLTRLLKDVLGNE